MGRPNVGAAPIAAMRLPTSARCSISSRVGRACLGPRPARPGTHEAKHVDHYASARSARRPGERRRVHRRRRDRRRGRTSSANTGRDSSSVSVTGLRSGNTLVSTAAVSARRARTRRVPRQTGDGAEIGIRPVDLRRVSGWLRRAGSVPAGIASMVEGISVGVPGDGPTSGRSFVCRGPLRAPPIGVAAGSRRRGGTGWRVPCRGVIR